jgi:hypothetical protein
LANHSGGAKDSDGDLIRHFSLSFITVTEEDGAVGVRHSAFGHDNSSAENGKYSGNGKHSKMGARSIAKRHSSDHSLLSGKNAGEFVFARENRRILPKMRDFVV